MSDGEKRLAEIRTQIDEIDDQLLNLISRRGRLAQLVAEIKQSAGGEIIYYRPEREAVVRERVCRENPGPLRNEELVGVFQEIMSVCRSLEQRLKVAFLGPAGTFTEAAALRHFGHAIDTLSLDTIDAVFREVESRTCEFGVVPIENSTEGVVNHTLDRFVRSPLSICGEVDMRIQQNLMGRVTALEEIRRVYSHQQSLAQCRHWLDSHLPGVETVSVNSNAEAARRASLESGSAALAGRIAAEAYDLNILAPNIEDEPNNTTRFLVIGRQPVPPTGRDKTSLLLSARNKPGALFALLEPLAKHGVSMTRIESRPSRIGMWEYVFFVDIEGHSDEEKVAKAVAAMGESALLIKVLGSYPRASAT